MAKMFNFTDRVDIPLECISVRNLTFQGNEVFLTVAWDFSILGLPSDANVKIELGAIGTFQTDVIDCGLLETGVLQSKAIPVSHIRNPNLIQFRVMISKRNDLGVPLILAEIDKVKPVLDKGSENGSSLLKRRKITNLGVPWELQFDSGIPVLCISGKKDMWFQLRKKAPWFDPIVLHKILGEIFFWTIQESKSPEDPEIFEEWKNYFVTLGASEDFYEQNYDILDQDSEDFRVVNDLCRQITEAFCIKFDVFGQISDITAAEVGG